MTSMQCSDNLIGMSINALTLNVLIVKLSNDPELLGSEIGKFNK